MGYAGNAEPSYIVPTAISSKVDLGSDDFVRSKAGLHDLEFAIGDEATARAAAFGLKYPIRHGLIDNWNDMERIWQRCFFRYLRCDPEEHHVLLTEPPLNPPENREQAAEIMFETFGVPGMYIAVQAVLALAASWPFRAKEEDRTLTGTVIDSGDGVTHVIPISDGYVLGSCIRHVPLAGLDITKFIHQQLRERGEPVPPEIALDVAKAIKEQHSYVCRDLADEFRRYDAKPDKYISKMTGVHPRTKKPWEVDIGYEKFLAGEMFFNPEIYDDKHPTPLPTLVDRAIQASPIDAKRSLYNNVVLSGGSTLMKNFGKRLQQDLRGIVKDRFDANRRRLAAVGSNFVGSEVKVKVVTHGMQRFAVFFGGSMMASTEQFPRYCHTKAQYEEEGSRIARHNPVFGF